MAGSPQPPSAPVAPEAVGIKFPSLDAALTRIKNVALNQSIDLQNEHNPQLRLMNGFADDFGDNASNWETAFASTDEIAKSGSLNRVSVATFGFKDIVTPATDVSLVRRGDLAGVEPQSAYPNLDTLSALSESFGILDDMTPNFDALKTKLARHSGEDDNRIEKEDGKQTTFRVETAVPGIAAEITIAKQTQLDDKLNNFILMIDRQAMGLKLEEV